MNYYYYIAGMPEIKQNSQQAAPTPEQIVEELRGELTTSDMLLLELVADKQDAPAFRKYVSQFEWDKSGEEPVEITLSEEQRTGYWYQFGMKCKNKFLCQWFEFNLDLNNVLTANICRNLGWDVRKYIIGNNRIAQLIRDNAKAKDFGLSGEWEHYSAIAQIYESDNMMEKEKRIDALKWRWLEENTFFKTFSIEVILTQYLKAEMLHRWNMLTVEEGEKAFREILGQLKFDNLTAEK